MLVEANLGTSSQKIEKISKSPISGLDVLKGWSLSYGNSLYLVWEDIQFGLKSNYFSLTRENEDAVKNVGQQIQTAQLANGTKKEDRFWLSILELGIHL